MTDLASAAAAWAADDPDPATAAEVRALIAAGDVAGLEQRFSERLQFGTAGLRGPIGAGPARMNRALVQRAAAGLAAWLDGRGPVAVCFDARHGSHAFAVDTCAVLAGAGIEVRLLPGPLPTPVLAFALRHLSCAAGVMVTASHNPAADNGYKVYDGTAGQIVPPTDASISAAIDAVGRLVDLPLGPVPAPLGPEVVDAYVAGALRAGLVGAGGRDVRIVTTATHGVGGPLLLRLLAAAGFGDVTPVAEQQDADPDFPTLPFPNPEEPGTLDLALALARSVGADVVLANDPDADRLGVAVPDPSAVDGWRVLRGDEIGVLLGAHVLQCGAGADRVVASSIVSSSMLGRIAASHGVRHAVTLTGFKWIVRSARPGERFAFGYEEALGYCVGDLVRDKDGLTAALCLAELAADLKGSGRTLLDALDDLARAHGVHATFQLTQRVGPIDQAVLMDRLRSDPPATLGTRPVVRTDDLSAGGELPPADVLIFHLPGARVIVRPSGTEPKIKAYLEVVQPVGPAAEALVVARLDAEAAIAALATDVLRILRLD